jgi:hypothetical protein
LKFVATKCASPSHIFQTSETFGADTMRRHRTSRTGSARIFNWLTTHASLRCRSPACSCPGSEFNLQCIILCDRGDESSSSFRDPFRRKKPNNCEIRLHFSHPFCGSVVLSQAWSWIWKGSRITKGIKMDEVLNIAIVSEG